MLHFFSFLCMIGKNSIEEMNFALSNLIKSLDKHIINYKFVLFTNLNLDLNHPKIEIKQYYDNSPTKNYYNGSMGTWLNMSFNKLFIWKNLYDEYKQNFIWTDLDLIVTHDIEYLENIDNFFVPHGGNREDKVYPIIENKLYVEMNKYIQGAFWKINLDLYNKLIDTLNVLNKSNIKIKYDSQGLFSYYLYSVIDNKFDESNIKVLGINFLPNVMGGLGIWCNDPHNQKHCNVDALNNLFWENCILKTNYYLDKEIHFVMFTFDTLRVIANTQKFKELFMS
jgi:hypothetical protein